MLADNHIRQHFLCLLPVLTDKKSPGFRFFCVYICIRQAMALSTFFSKHLQISNNHRIFAADIKTLVL